MTVRIRRAGPADLPALLDLHRRFCVVDGHEFSSEAAEAGFGPLLVDDEIGVVWLAETGVTAAGYAVVTWGWSIESGGRDALLDEIYAEPPGAGIGTALVAHIVGDLTQRGLPRVFLETETSNEAARSLYLRCGFVIEDSIWMSRQIPSPPS